MYFDIDKIIAVAIIAYIWSVLDKIRWNYPTTIFSKIGGEGIQRSLNPNLSQQIKWRFKPAILDFLFSTCLVWITDLWHFVKMLLLCAIFYTLYKFKPDQKWWIEVLVMFVVYGAVFEMNYQMDWFWWIRKKDKK